MLGVIIFLFKSKVIKFFKNNFLYYLNFFILILCLLYFNENTRHPGILTLIPLICSSYIILNNRRCFLQNFFNLNLFQTIGKISYSLYLNHYILIAIFNIYLTQFGNFFHYLIYFLTLLIFSFFTFSVIENNFRYSKSNTNIKTFSLILVFFISIILNLNFVIKKGFPERFENIYSKDYFAYPWTLLEDSHGKCFDRDTPCKFDNGQNKDIYLLGSSISVGIMSFIKNEKIFNQFNWFIYSGSGLSIENNLENIFKNEKNKIIILDTFYLNSIGKLDQILNILKNRNKPTIILIYPYLKFPNSINKIIYHKKDGAFFNLQVEKFNPKNKILNLKDYFKINEIIFHKLDDIKNKNILRIYPHKIFCDEENCQPIQNKKILFVDVVHMSMEGSKIFSDELIFDIISLIK